MKTRMMKRIGWMLMLVGIMSLTSCDVEVRVWHDDVHHSDHTPELCSRTWEESWVDNGNRYTQRLTQLGYKIAGSLVSKTTFCDKTYVISSPKNPSSPKVSSDLGFSNYYLNPDYSSNADVILLIGKDI